VKKVNIRGGAPTAICDAMSFIGASWNEDDTIIYGTEDQGIMQVSDDGGIPETLIESEDGAVLVNPQILPGGKSVLYQRWQNVINMILVHSLESGETNELFAGQNPRYLSSGHLVYILDGNLLAIPFDPDTLEVGGQRLIVDNVGPYSISDEGTLVFIPVISGTTASGSTLVWMDREGNEEPLALSPADYNDVSISPNGTQLALEIDSDGNSDIWIWDLDRKFRRQFTLDDSNEGNPVWTPDSKRIIFGSDRTERGIIFWKAADGTGEIEQLTEMTDEDIWPESISNDGNTLIIGNYKPTNMTNIGMLSMEDDDHKPELLLQEEYFELYPEISPDGRWLAYTSNEFDLLDVFVHSFPDVGKGKWRITTDGGRWPLWSQDSRELFYRGPEGLMSVSVEAGSAFQYDTPKLLFKSQYELCDIHPVDKRFLMRKPVGMTEDESAGGFPRKIYIFLNWFEELKERVPTD
jgi:dipeptidyl aminopeptidase/acylaminoacyl peptidase